MGKPLRSFYTPLFMQCMVESIPSMRMRQTSPDSSLHRSIFAKAMLGYRIPTGHERMRKNEKVMGKLKTISNAAKESASKSRKCANCDICMLCTPDISKVCAESHIEGYEKGAKNYSKIVEKDLVRLFDKLYGRDYEKRIQKLQEELDELKFASTEYVLDFASRECLIDEMSDVVAVIAHIANILGTDINKLLLQALDKVQGRQIDPNYKRKHQHETA